MTIEELFGTLQMSVVSGWRKHLRSAKYGKHIAVYPYFVESKHPYRLYKISSDYKYSEENIRYRLINNKKYNRQVIHTVKRRYKGDFNKTRKLTGYNALYFRFLYMLGVLPKKQLVSTYQSI